MDIDCNLARWIEENKQIGKVFSYEKDGELYWSSVAIQKWGDIYKVYVDEILESQMDSENYLREEIVKFDCIESAVKYVSECTMVSPDELTPCKGQKVFNPEFD